MSSSFSRSNQAFTLAEVLIALALLGVVAAFSIPKILQSQTEQRRHVIFKETVSMISQAWDTYKLNNIPSANTTANDIAQYFNTLGEEATASIDNRPQSNFPAPSWSCADANLKCLRLHSGAILAFHRDNRFAGTSNLNSIFYMLDTDGRFNETTLSGDGKEQTLFLYFNGQIRLNDNEPIGSISYYQGSLQTTATDPPASWDLSWATWN